MSDEQKPQSTGGMLVEMTAVHLVGTMVVRIFFRWQASENNTFWEAGDESFLANGFNALLDIMYWLVKPRIMKWRNG